MERATLRDLINSLSKLPDEHLDRAIFFFDIARVDRKELEQAIKKLMDDKANWEVRLVSKSCTF